MSSSLDPVKLLHRLVELYSPTGQEAAAAGLLAGEMRSLGLLSRIDRVGNVVAEYGGSGPTILLCGHMDTVPGRLPVRIDGGRLYGRGAVDAKSALAAMISAAGILIKEGFQSKLIVVGAVDEEGRSQGIKNLIEEGVRADYAVFGEPSGVENITIAYKGSCRLKIICRTKTGHSSASWLFHSAVEEVLDFCRGLQGIHFPEEKTESKFYSLTSTVTQIHGGGRSSTVPSICELHADFRLPPAVSVDRFLQEVSNAKDIYHRSRPSVELEVKVEDSCEPYEADRDSLLVRGLAWAVRNVKSRQATLLRKTGTGDMNLFGAKFGVPAVTYGPGDSKLDHTENESVDLEEYLDSIRILQRGLLKVLELHHRFTGK